MKRSRLDTASIKTTTLFSFVVFALFLLAVLWGLAHFFIDTYYEKARTQEVIRTANVLETEFRQNPEGFSQFAIQTAGTSGIYIRLDTPGESLVYDGIPRSKRRLRSFGGHREHRSKARGGRSGSVTEVKIGASQAGSRLLYASHLNRGGDVNTLYIIAPLHPDPATFRILRNMLFYISFIFLIVSTVLAYMLSRRITLPIENLTKAATELSQGNYNVKFDGSAFTETKELAKALNKASYEMEKTDFYQREIIANVSHDLKTPLTMIRSYAEKIMDISGDDPKKRDADLHVIISETERLNRLVGDMLSVSNLQSNNLEMHMEAFDIVEAARDVYESFNVLSSSRGL